MAVRLNYATPRADGTSSVVANVLYDCAVQRSRWLRQARYDAQGQPISAPEDMAEDAFQADAPGTLAGLTDRDVCRVT